MASGAKRLLRSLFSDDSYWRYDLVRRSIQQARRKSPAPRTCPICAYQGPFHPFGWPIRPEAKCPSCRSLERHRFFKLWVDENLQDIRDKDVLHFAPEDCISGILKPLARRYVTADIDEHRADLRIDIESMDLPDHSFDVIVCFHVLEHVNDRAALKEMSRVLRPDGVALLMFPVDMASPTYEDPSITSPEQRTLHFGQADHLRIFGYDAKDRIESMGFSCSTVSTSGAETMKYGTGSRRMFLARPSTNNASALV